MAGPPSGQSRALQSPCPCADGTPIPPPLSPTHMHKSGEPANQESHSATMHTATVCQPLSYGLEIKDEQNNCGC